MTCAPWPPLEAKIISEQERLETDAIAPNIPARCVSCANKVTQRFMQFVG
jgi:hypothetical protein